MCDRFPVNINPTISGADTGYNVVQELRLSHRVSRGARPVSTLYRDDITWQSWSHIRRRGTMTRWWHGNTFIARFQTRTLSLSAIYCDTWKWKRKASRSCPGELSTPNILSLPQIHWLDFKFRFDTYYQWAALPSICPRNKSPKQKRFLKNIQFYIVMSWALGICARQSQDE